MTRILLAGDHFVLNEHLKAAILDRIGAAPVSFAELTLPWPVVPFGPVAEVNEASDVEQEMMDLIGGVEICVTQMAPITRRVLDRAANLRLVCVTRGGPINVNLEAAQTRGISVMSAPGRNAIATAEHTIALALSALRRIPQIHNGVVAGEWRSDLYSYPEVAFELHGAPVGIVGYGAVGRHVARIFNGFGAHVRVFDPFAPSVDDFVERVGTLDALLAGSRIVSLHARLTPETRNMIGAAQLAVIPDGGILVNAARGGLVDMNAVASALETGKLMGAAFDVFDIEPLPSGAKIRQAPNVTLSPHLAGATQETARRAASIAADQVSAYLKDKTIAAAV
ncbi:2-hydroxyacid dehydrogenase [Devosia ginsengisoli]|uniref:2-hydroxyacid dehydrogenase n=1 Tax=Devosia ginsengisoli TaxID=400770 RepID=UPI0026EBEF1A|nr:2-hydroxyacid dehydrogenase [Devosia ginsengisoli]MCR6670087.1 2-hydroxyacid dehydrogenase [Devosia ginsengisoli]